MSNLQVVAGPLSKQYTLLCLELIRWLDSSQDTRHTIILKMHLERSLFQLRRSHYFRSHNLVSNSIIIKTFSVIQHAKRTSTCAILFVEFEDWICQTLFCGSILCLPVVIELSGTLWLIFDRPNFGWPHKMYASIYIVSGLTWNNWHTKEHNECWQIVVHYPKWSLNRLLCQWIQICSLKWAKMNTKNNVAQEIFDLFVR